MINAAVDFSAKRRKTTRRKTPKKREAQFFFAFLISQKKGLKTSKTSLNCTHWLLLLVSLLGITRQFQRWCWYWWRFVCLMLNPQPHPCCLWSPIVDSQKWGCESEFLSYKGGEMNAWRTNPTGRLRGGYPLTCFAPKHLCSSSLLLWKHHTIAVLHSIEKWYINALQIFNICFRWWGFYSEERWRWRTNQGQ